MAEELIDDEALLTDDEDDEVELAEELDEDAEAVALNVAIAAQHSSVSVVHEKVQDTSPVAERVLVATFRSGCPESSGTGSSKMLEKPSDIDLDAPTELPLSVARTAMASSSACVVVTVPVAMLPTAELMYDAFSLLWSRG